MDPLDGADDRVGRVPAMQVEAAADERGPRLVVRIARPSRGSFRSMDVYRRTLDGSGRVLVDWQLVASEVGSRQYVDTDVEAGQFYAYRARPVVVATPRGGGNVGGNGGGNLVAPALPVEAVAAIAHAAPIEAKADPYAPEGTLLIDDADGHTASRHVRLLLSADDSADNHGDDAAETGAVPGTSISELEMRISNSADLSGLPWQPFAAVVEDWDLGELRPGQTATVYVQFRDAAGNIGEGDGQADTTIYLPGDAGRGQNGDAIVGAR
jgi:hypothetical protein